MSASTSDKITDARNGSRPLSAAVVGTRVAGGDTLTCDDLSGWPDSTSSKVHFVTYQKDANNLPIAGTQLDCTGIVSGNTITSVEVIDGEDNGNLTNDVVEMLPTAAWAQDLADGLTETLNRDGTLRDNIVGSSNIAADAVGSSEIATGAVGAAEIADAVITNAKMAITNSTDANGWNVISLGTVKVYQKSFSVNVAATNGQRSTAVNTTTLPVGISDLSQLYHYCTWRGGYSGHAVLGFEASSTNINISLGNQYSGGSLTFVGNIHVMLVKIA